MTINFISKKKIIFFVCIFLFIFLQSYIFFDFISGNTLIHAVLSKYLTENGVLFINLFGDKTNYFLHVHTTLYSHLLTILNQFSNIYYLNVKILNFLIFAVFIFWYLYSFRQKSDYLAILIWLFIPTVFHSFNTSDPGMSLGYIFPVILFYLLDKEPKKLVEFFYIGLTIFFYFWTKETSALFLCVSIFFSSLILKKKKFNIILTIFLSFLTFLISYIIYINFYGAPFNLIELFLSHQNSNLDNFFIGSLYFLKGLFLWVGIGLCYFLFFNLYLYNNLFRNYSSLVIIIFFFLYFIISTVNGSLFPRYLNECLLPLLIIILRKIKNYKFEFKKREFIPLLIIFFFTILFVKDISITTNNLFSNLFVKSVIIFFPLLIYLVFNHRYLNNLTINYLITYVFLPSILIIYFQVNSNYKNYVQGNYLKGYDETIHFVNEIRNDETVIIIDNLDLSLYFDNKFFHPNITNDLPNYDHKTKNLVRFKKKINSIKSVNFIYIERNRYSSKNEEEKEYINSVLLDSSCLKNIKDFNVNYSCILK
jgi:hypothetical protein